MIAVTESDNGREFTLSRGDRLEISLPVTSGTGYTWQAAELADAFAYRIAATGWRNEKNNGGCIVHPPL